MTPSPAKGEDVRINFKLAAMAIALLCAGCAVETHDELIAEAQRLAPPGMPTQQAQAALMSAGFNCGKSYVVGKGDIMCDRMQSAFIAGCVQHVLLSFDAQKSSVASLDVTGPYCAGL